ncbi:MAG: transcription elongation factor [Acidilobaceae archaeon]|nr:transcription elongation factor [Acidilobaceae archaeon]MCX8164988.1 transcription elongation factor [Acidilobaceae archaeon]MDW7974495.1 DNA-directed RNA polymerase subunit M [Sulfolobales archaeon]
MKFCPKCGSVMVPVKRENEVISKCNRCGYEEKMEGKEEYKTTVKGSEKVITTKVISKKKGIEVKRDEELEQAKDSYYEIVLDQIGEYGE